MKMEKTISVYINTIGFGYAILTDGEILDCGMVTVRPADNSKAFCKINEITGYFQPNILILEDYEKSNKSERVKKLIKKLYDYWKDKIKIHRYSRQQVKDTFQVFGARNKFEIGRKIVDIYPQLTAKLPDKRKPWEPENYYQGIFDAMALEMTHLYLNN